MTTTSVCVYWLMLCTVFTGTLGGFLNERGQRQRRQQSDLAVLKKQLIDVELEIQTLEQNPVYPGFIYFQLSPSPPPTQLWPEMGWIDVSSLYAGQFFRVAGGNSAEFGVNQGEDSSKLSTVYRTQGGSGGGGQILPLPLGSRSYVLWTGDAAGTPATGRITLDFLTSDAEVRPENQAIRIWKAV